MKRTALALMLIALAASCNTEPKTAVQKKVDSYALVKIESPDLSGITDNGKEVLNLYKFAADQADAAAEHAGATCWTHQNHLPLLSLSPFQEK